MEIIKCFFDFNFNEKEVHNYLVNTKTYTISNKIITNFDTKIRKYIYLYFIAEYLVKKETFNS